MNHTSESPFRAFRRQHPAGSLDAETEILIHQWVDVNHRHLVLFDHFDDMVMPWSTKESSEEPDMVSYIATYGYSRTVNGDWTRLPIDIPAEEVENWEKNASVPGSMKQLRRDQAGIVGGLAIALENRCDELVGLIKSQLQDAYAELDRLMTRPIDEFAPSQWDDEAMAQEVVGEEIQELDRIFDLYETLWCFEQGIEELRMLMITEDNPELHLPSQRFYDALMSVNSHELMEHLHQAEPKLRQILKLWSRTKMVYTGKPYHRPYDKNAPTVFWWRHRRN